MKPVLLLVSFLLCCCFPLRAQFLVLPAGNGNTRVDIGRLDVSGKSITVEALITVQPASVDANIISKHFDPGDVSYVFRITGFFIRTNRGGTAVRNPVVLCLNKVYHVAATYDGDSLRYFVNGVQVASVPCTGNLNLNNDITAIGSMEAQHGAGEQFHGYLSEVRIWNVARTAAEISASMLDLPHPTLQKGLLAYYKFNGSFVNSQGNPKWNGKPSDSRVTSGKNPYFSGEVSYSFCGGPLVKAPEPAKLPPVLPIAKKPVEAVKATAVPNIDPPVSKPEPLPAAAVKKDLTPPVVSPEKAEKPNYEHAIIQVWDFDGLDGDSVALRINGKQLGPTVVRLSEFRRYGTPELTFAVDLIRGNENTLELLAVSEGSIPLATVGLLISSDKKSQKYYFKLHRGESIAVHFIGNP